MSTEVIAFDRSAGPWLTAGLTSESATSATTRVMAMGRGGLVRACGTRWVCTHSSTSTPSGMPMCRNESSENSRSLTFSGKTKLRISVPLKTGSQSNHSMVATTTNCAYLSQGNM